MQRQEHLPRYPPVSSPSFFLSPSATLETAQSKPTKRRCDGDGRVKEAGKERPINGEIDTTVDQSHEALLSATLKHRAFFPEGDMQRNADEGLCLSIAL